MEYVLLSIPHGISKNLSIADFNLFLIIAVFTAIFSFLYSLKKGTFHTILILATRIFLTGAMIIISLWLFLNNQKELFTALSNLVILVITTLFSFMQFNQTIKNTRELSTTEARPEIINPYPDYNEKNKELRLHFKLFSKIKQPVLDINGELFLSFDSKSESYNYHDHFDNIGTQITNKKLIAKINPYKNKSNSDRENNFIVGNYTFRENTGFQYLIYFRTRELENGVAVYLHGTNGYMAYYSKRDKTWYKYDQLDKNISEEQIKIIESYRK